MLPVRPLPTIGENFSLNHVSAAVLGEVPTFVIDRKGDIIPRHTVYYIILKDPSRMGELVSYLNGPVAREWLTANCQRAANGFLRVQSQVLKKLPVPAELAPGGRQHRAAVEADRQEIDIEL